MLTCILSLKSVSSFVNSSKLKRDKIRNEIFFNTFVFRILSKIHHGFEEYGFFVVIFELLVAFKINILFLLNYICFKNSKNLSSY